MLNRGSEWRRWDLHVHTPDTALNDQFGSWDEYLTAVESHPDVVAMGVTDYMSITNYSTLKQHKAKGRLKNIQLLIPNIEFRIAPPSDKATALNIHLLVSDKATALNIHLLVSPEELDHEREILQALGRLDWRYGTGKYSCLPEQLIALGRAFGPSATGDKAALAVGVTQFKVDFTRFRDWYVDEPWLRRHSLVAVAAGDDGLSGFNRDGAWGGFREEITRFSQILFSGRPGEREFWLGRDSEVDRQTLTRLGGPKPVVHGSDAHKLADIFKPAHDRFCWLKADPTFEGLRQILYEPGDRVFIGPPPPLYHDEARVISAARIAHANGWIDDITIPFNPGLVAIVGQKGSGKSALAELISYAAGSWHEDATSFLQRAGDHLDGLTITLEWADGTASTAELWGQHSGNNEVRYLSQKFVERLCAEDQIGSELVHEIEAVVFSYIDPTDTLNASDFAGLRALRTDGIRNEGERLQEDINRLIREECALRASAQKRGEKEARIQTLTQERDGLLKQMPQPTSKEEAQLQQDLQTRRNELVTAQKAINVEKQKLQKIADLKTQLGQFKAQATRFQGEIDAALRDVGVAEADREAYRIQFAGDTDAPLTRRAAEIRRGIDAREGAVENPAKGTVRWLEQQIKLLTERDTADKARQQRIKTIQTRVSAIGTELERLTAEVAQIKGPARARLDGARQERLDAYVAYFENLKREQTTLEELYQPIKKKLADGTAAPQEQELEFSIRWQPDLDTWLERGSLLFDQRTANPYGSMEDLKSVTRERLLPAWASGDPTRIRAALDTFVAQFRKPTPRPEQYLRNGVTIQDVLEWMYSVDHVRLSYGLKYNGVELEKLSPGTKGIVLLILYLGMDTGDTRPLLVDQPDENLDNESIYALLTTYFKNAKRRRQIVLITHNPNLVVNGDAEQVIVATARRRPDGLPHMTYTAGALENTCATGDGIRDQVCRILEGGTDAFRKREKRYALARI